MDWYYLWAVILVVLLLASWALNFISLPGNWLIVICAAVFAILFPASAGHGIGWVVVVVAAVLAGIGELIEFGAAALGATKVGGSKRGAALAIVGSIVGALVGVFVGLPIPIVGPIIAAVLFAAIGALAGAVLGEQWKGKDLKESLQVGQAAFWGRLFGSLAKISIGLAMVLALAIAAFF